MSERDHRSYVKDHRLSMLRSALNKMTVKDLKQVAQLLYISSRFYNTASKKKLIEKISWPVERDGLIKTAVLYKIAETSPLGFAFSYNDGKEAPPKEKKDDPMESENTPRTDPEPAPVPAPATGLEGALTAMIMGSIEPVIEAQLTKRGVTAASVEKIVTKIMENKAMPQLVKRKLPKEGEPKFALVHDQFKSAKFWLDMGQSVYLNGPAGSGKTVAAQQLADHFEKEITIISCHGEMTVYDLCGYRDGHGKYNPTPFYEAWHKGDIILIDEVDKSPGEVNVFLNAATAQGVITFPNGERLEKRKTCRMIFTGNTKMSGADAVYSAGQRQDGSFSNRLIAIDWPFDSRLEISLARQECKAFGGDDGKAEAAYDTIKAIRKAIDEFGMSYVVGQRQTMMAAAAIGTGRAENHVFDEVVYGWMNPQDAKRVKERVKKG